MMKIETTKMSSRGQIVIPQDAREEIKAEEGTIFAVIASGDTLVLKKIKQPSREELIKRLDEMAREGSKRAQEKGIQEKDIPDLIHKLREEKRKLR